MNARTYLCGIILMVPPASSQHSIMSSVEESWRLIAILMESRSLSFAPGSLDAYAISISISIYRQDGLGRQVPHMCIIDKR